MFILSVSLYVLLHLTNNREYDVISYLKTQGKDIGYLSDSELNLYHSLFWAFYRSSSTLVLERTWKLDASRY